MDKTEAHKILGEQLVRFSDFSALAPLADSGQVQNFEVSGSSGAKYQVEVQFFWDDKLRQTIRVCGLIDDGGIRAYIPLTETLLIPRRETPEKPE
jgi:ribosomal protein S8